MGWNNQVIAVKITTNDEFCLKEGIVMGIQLKLDHVSLLVRDLDQAIKDWQEVLSVLDPEQAKNVIRVDGGLDEDTGERMNWATFVNPEGTSIQLFEPAGEGGFLNKVLDKKGEYVHHIAFTTTDIQQTMKDLQDKGIPLTKDVLANPDKHPWLKWCFVTPKKAHGPLIEVARSYIPDVEKGEWVINPADAPIDGE